MDTPGDFYLPFSKPDIAAIFTRFQKILIFYNRKNMINFIFMI
jgi:hypothetical protein